jgi:hypothetical protein
MTIRILNEVLLFSCLAAFVTGIVPRGHDNARLMLLTGWDRGSAVIAVGPLV